jgi:hypothetical protein
MAEVQLEMERAFNTQLLVSKDELLASKEDNQKVMVQLLESREKYIQLLEKGAQ